MSDVEGKITLLKAELGPEMDNRYTDKAFYYILLDAIEGDSDLELVGQNVFRPKADRPVVDDFIMDDDVVLDILSKLNYSEPV